MSTLVADVVALQKRNALLEGFIAGALTHSLHQIRSAAFTPALGVRYTEPLRLKIARECWNLEEACREILRG